MLPPLGAKHQGYNYQVGLPLCIFKQGAKSEDLSDLNSGL